MQVGAVGGGVPVQMPARAPAPQAAGPVSTDGQAEVLAAGTLNAIFATGAMDAALAGMQQAMAGLTSGLSF